MQHRQRVRHVAMWLATLALLASAYEGQAGAVDVPLDGKRIRLTDSPRPTGRRNLVALFDVDVDLSAVDPRVTGATAYVGPPGGGIEAMLEMPPSGWVQTGNAPRIDYKYKSRSGGVRTARLIDGRSIRFSAFGTEAYALAGVPQGAVGVVVQIGAVRFCGTFGGTVKRDDGQRFIASHAPAPAVCPAVGPTTTTSTSTSTTTTSSSSSSTTSSSTSTTTTSTTSTTAGGCPIIPPGCNGQVSNIPKGCPCSLNCADCVNSVCNTVIGICQ